MQSNSKIKSLTAEIKSRGQLTIPKKIREAGNLEEGRIVSIIPIGEAIVIAPKKIGLDEARMEIKKIIKSSGVSLEELLKGLDKEREKLFKEKYASKN